MPDLTGADFFSDALGKPGSVTIEAADEPLVGVEESQEQEDQSEDGRSDRGDGRDVRGRFAPGQRPIGDDDGGGEDDEGRTDDRQGERAGVPSYRMRELRQERDGLLERAVRAETALHAVSSRIDRLEQGRQQQQQPQRPDPFAQTDEFVADLDQRTQRAGQAGREAVRDAMINLTFEAMHEERGDEFADAYQLLRQASQRNDPVVDRITQAGNPGRALMRWYDNMRREHEINQAGGLDAYIDQQLEARLDQEDFAERARKKLGVAGGDQQVIRRGPGTGGQSTVVRLPSLTRAGGGGGGNYRPGSANMPVTGGDFFADAVGGLPISRMRSERNR